MRKVLLSDRSLQLLFGPFDENVKFLEDLFGVAIQARDSSLIIDGEEEDVASLESILVDFSALVDKGHAIANGDLKSAFKQIAADAALSLHDFFPKMQLLTTGKRQVTPKSPNQRRYVEAIRNSDIVFGIGPGGTGKTFLAVAMAISHLFEKSVSRIVLTRPAVEAGERLGFLPQAKIDIHQAVARLLIVWLQRADLLVGLQRLAPIQALHVNICQAV